jgi:hypothetical protein
MELAFAWAEAVLAGATPPGCPDDLDLPDCTPQAEPGRHSSGVARFTNPTSVDS